MKLESALSSINRILRATAKTFSLQSIEYQNMKYLVESIADNIDIFIKTNKGEPIKLSRSKTALRGLKNFQSDIEETLEVMREAGTVLKQAKKYDPTLTAARLQKPVDAKRIRKKAVMRAAENNLVPDWYAAIDEIDDPKLQAAARDRFANPQRLKGEARERQCDEAIEYVRKCLLDEGAALKELDVEKSKKLGKGATLAEALATQK